MEVLLGLIVFIVCGIVGIVLFSVYEARQRECEEERPATYTVIKYRVNWPGGETLELSLDDKLFVENKGLSLEDLDYKKWDFEDWEIYKKVEGTWYPWRRWCWRKSKLKRKLEEEAKKAKQQMAYLGMKKTLRTPLTNKESVL